MSTSTKGNLPSKAGQEFYKSDIFFEKTTWPVYRPDPA